MDGEGWVVRKYFIMFQMRNGMNTSVLWRALGVIFNFKIQPTLTGRCWIPRRPHLNREKGCPTDDISQDDHKSHFHCGYLRLGDELHAAHAGQCVAFGGFGRQAYTLLPPGFQFKVLPYFEAYQPVANAQYRHWNDVYGETDPCDVCLGSPRLHEISPAVVHS